MFPSHAHTHTHKVAYNTREEKNLNIKLENKTEILIEDVNTQRDTSFSLSIFYFIPRAFFIEQFFRAAIFAGSPRGHAIYIYS